MLEQMLAQPDELAQMGVWAAQYIRDDWTWEKSLQDLLRLFRETMKLSRGADLQSAL